MADAGEAAPQPDREKLVACLDAFLEAEGDNLHRLLATEAHTLLHPAAEAMLRSAAEDAADKGDSRAEAIYTAHAELLAACRAEQDQAMLPGLLREFATMDAQPKACAIVIGSHIIPACPVRISRVVAPTGQ